MIVKLTCPHCGGTNERRRVTELTTIQCSCHAVARHEAGKGWVWEKPISYYLNKWGRRWWIRHEEDQRKIQKTTQR